MKKGINKKLYLINSYIFVTNFKNRVVLEKWKKITLKPQN